MPVDELALHVLWRLVFTPQRSSPLTSPVNFIARTPPTPSATPGGPAAGGVGGQVLGGSVDLKGPYARAIEFDDPTEASEVVLLADLLLRILDRVATRSEAEDD